jgi:2,4-dienoyl-CoA reductase-like NADH-dependent reductase (Old Yellow Enzyme family)
MSALFQPFKIRSLTLRNRIGVAPMCQYSAVDGVPQPWHMVHLGSRATGGAGLIIAEATGVLPEGRITLGCTGLWNDTQAAAWAPIAAFIKSQGAVPGIQLGHAGRKASAALPQNGGASLSDAEGGWPTVAPSAIAFGGGLSKVPTALDAAGIARIRQAFTDAAQRALGAGFEWLELHGAHGYLINEFLSPLANQRTDDYGGSFENRTRLLREITIAIRKVWPETLPLAVRLSSVDGESGVDGGWTLDDSVALAQQLKPLGVDLIDCSAGGVVSHAQFNLVPGYQVPYAERIRKDAVIATAAVGLITEPAQAEAIIAEGKADLVLLARAFLRDPYWAWHAAKALGETAESAKPPVQYARA